MARFARPQTATLLAALALASTALTQARAAEFASAIALSSLDGATGFRLDGIDAFDFSGVSVASAGDVNGDGFGDIVIGAEGGNPNVDTRAGESYVVFGKASGFGSAIDLGGLNGSTGFRLDGVDAEDRSGASVAAAGDVNGDGFADLVIGAKYGDPGGDTDAGESYVVLGKASGFASAMNLGTLNGATGFRLNGVDAYDRSGWSVAAAGDVNRDGFGDIVIGAYLGDPNGDLEAGESYVVFGKGPASGGFASAINLGGLNGTTGFRLNGIDEGDGSGRSVASAGDVNGDGFADIVIGAYGGDPNGDLEAGESYVVFGKASGFASAIDLGGLNGTTGFRLDGIDTNDGSGNSVASAGDVNGDGFADLIVGARFADPGGDSSAGESYVVFGTSTGFASAIDLAGLNGATGFRLDGIDTGDLSGHSAASAGDVNGDGFADIVIGAFGGDPGGDSAAGESYVVFGKDAGFGSAIDLGSLNGTTGFRLDGIDASDESGYSTASAGDVNGDGFADIVIGAPNADPNTDSRAGESYVVFGRAPDAAVTRVGSAAGQYISGGAFADTIYGGDGNDSLEGRGLADSLDGGNGNDTATYLHAPSGVIANLAAPGGNSGDAAGDTYTAIENLTGSRFADTLTGNASANRLDGGKGADTLLGGGGNDRLAGGPGKDAMTGGAGADIFLFNRRTESVAGSGRDRIADFQAGSSSTSVDRIDLRPIDAKAGVAGNQAFSFIGTNAFSNVKGQLRIALAGTTTIVSGDVNGDGVADFQIGLLNFTNLANLTGIDFLK